ncbi:hypothetical protein BDV19DRAFT_387109 [Aspergillus venezuelensis]
MSFQGSDPEPRSARSSPTSLHGLPGPVDFAILSVTQHADSTLPHGKIAYIDGHPQRDCHAPVARAEHPDDGTNETPRSLPILLVKWVTLQVSALVAATMFLSALVALLICFDGKPRKPWRHGSLNFAISVLSAAFGIAIACALEGQIGQEKYLRLAESSPPMQDLQNHDSASRAPLGAVQLPFKERLRKLALYTIFLCAAAVISKGFGMMGQMAMRDQEVVVSTASTPLLAKSSSYISHGLYLPGADDHFDGMTNCTIGLPGNTSIAWFVRNQLQGGRYEIPSASPFTIQAVTPGQAVVFNDATMSPFQLITPRANGIFNFSELSSHATLWDELKSLSLWEATECVLEHVVHSAEVNLHNNIFDQFSLNVWNATTKGLSINKDVEGAVDGLQLTPPWGIECGVQPGQAFSFGLNASSSIDTFLEIVLSGRYWQTEDDYGFESRDDRSWMYEGLSLTQFVGERPLVYCDHDLTNRLQCTMDTVAKAITKVIRDSAYNDAAPFPGWVGNSPSPLDDATTLNDAMAVGQEWTIVTKYKTELAWMVSFMSFLIVAVVCFVVIRRKSIRLRVPCWGTTSCRLLPFTAKEGLISSKDEPRRPGMIPPVFEMCK